MDESYLRKRTPTVTSLRVVTLEPKVGGARSAPAGLEKASWLFTHRRGIYVYMFVICDILHPFCFVTDPTAARDNREHSGLLYSPTTGMCVLSAPFTCL